MRAVSLHIMGTWVEHCEALGPPRHLLSSVLVEYSSTHMYHQPHVLSLHIFSHQRIHEESAARCELTLARNRSSRHCRFRFMLLTSQGSSPMGNKGKLCWLLPHSSPARTLTLDLQMDSVTKAFSNDWLDLSGAGGAINQPRPLWPDVLPSRYVVLHQL